MMKNRRCVSVAVLVLLAAPANSQAFVLQDSVDLNSDGNIEHIQIEFAETPYYRTILRIDEAEVEVELGDLIDGFQVVDINAYDKYKEVAVHTPGPSDDDEYLIFWYDGENIKRMAYLARWPTFLGNGIVYVNDWVGFWSKRDKYVLDNTRRVLEHVPQFAYYVGVELTVDTGFTIYRTADLEEKVALLSTDSEIELLLCHMESDQDFDHRYLIKSKSGLVGWARFEEIYDNASGFVMAD